MFTLMGKQAAASKVLTLHFHRDAQKDAVTGAVTYTPWQAVDGTSFAAVKSPVITGYTANTAGCSSCLMVFQIKLLIGRLR